MCRLAWRWFGAWGMRRSGGGEGGWWPGDVGGSRVRSRLRISAPRVEMRSRVACRSPARCLSGSAAGDRERVDPFDLVGELGKGTGDRAQRDPFERGAERRDGVVEAFPQLRVAATVAVAAELVGE